MIIYSAFTMNGMHANKDRVCDEEGATDSEVREIHPHFARDACAEPHV